MLGCFVSYAAAQGIFVYTLPVLYPELIDEFGWNSEQMTRPATLGYILGAIMVPFVSALFDRYSVRISMILGVFGITLGLALYPRIGNLAHLMWIYVIFAFGQVGCGLVPNMLLMTRWFRRRRGIAIGIVLLGSTIGGALFPLIVKAVLDGGNWRDAVAILALIGGTLMLIPVIAFIRNKPADMGLLPDGDQTIKEDTIPDITATGPTLRQAIKTPAFYLLLVATGGLWFTATGILQHQSIYIGRELGVETGTIALIVSLFFWGAIAGKLIFGWLSDHLDKTLMMLAATLLLIVGLMILRFSSAGSPFMLYGYALIFGIGFSGSFTMIQIVVAEFFAGQSYGRILGIFTMVDVGAGGIGINAVGRMEVAAGTYTTVLEGLAGLCVLIAGIIIVLYRMQPTKKEAEAEASYG